MPETQFSMTLKKIGELCDYFRKYFPGDIDDTKKNIYAKKKQKFKKF